MRKTVNWLALVGCLTVGGIASAQIISGGKGGLTLGTYSAAGTTQGTATLVSSNINIITTVASGAGVILAGTAVSSQSVLDQGANTLLVYPNSGAQINSLGTNVGFSIASGSSASFSCPSSTQCYVQFSSFQ